MSAFETLKQRAKKLLEIGEVKGVIGYTRGTTPDHRRPAFAESALQLETFILDKACENNLAAYLIADGLFKDDQKIAVFLNPCGIRSLNVLAAEDQIKIDQVVILGYTIDGESLTALDGSSAAEFADLVKQLRSQGLSKERADLIDKIEKMSADQRFDFWQEQFSKCVKCYACRQGCPMCYCKRCIVDRNQPQWINTSSHTLGNFEWNAVRAFHLAGRCIGCGNCERNCPVGIPLMLLNQRMAKEVLDAFDHFAGETAGQEPVLASYKREDPETFIL